MLFAPQQNVAPFVVRPHVNDEPTVIFAKDIEPLTRTGVVLEPGAPVAPNCFQSLLPQQYALLSVVTPHV